MSRGSLLALPRSVVIAVLLVPCVAHGSVGTDIGNFVRQFYGDKDVQVTFAQIPARVKDGAKVKTISFAKVPDAKGDGICLVGIEDKNGTEGNAYVPFRVLMKRKFYMFKRDVAKGDVIRPADVTEKETYLNGSGAPYPAGFDDIDGRAAKKATRAGEIITRDLLEEQITLRKGETVSIVAHNSHLTVETKGVALEKGRMGEFVRVRGPSGKEILGKILGNSTVMVEF